MKFDNYKPSSFDENQQNCSNDKDIKSNFLDLFIFPSIIQGLYPYMPYIDDNDDTD